MPDADPNSTHSSDDSKTLKQASEPKKVEIRTPTKEATSPDHEPEEEGGEEDIESDQQAGDKFESPEHSKQVHPMTTPAINKRRQATKHIIVNSPTDNIFSPISQKLLGRKRNDPTRSLPDA